MAPFGRLRAARLTSRAKGAALGRRWAEAAALYEAAARLRPDSGRILVQAGHMRKEAGDLQAAERHYQAALRLMPDDPDLALQLGHFHHLAGRLAEARSAYQRAATLRPDWSDPRVELARLATVALRRDEVGERALADDGRLLAPASDLLYESSCDRLLPEYLPSEPGRVALADKGVSIRRLGRLDRTGWGTARTLRGIEAILGACVSREPIRDVQILFNGYVVHEQAVRAYPLPADAGGPPACKYVFNAWIDVSGFVPGRYHVELRFRGTDGADARRSFSDHVVIKPPAPAPGLPGSEAWVPPVDPDDPRPLDAQIDARPSVVRAAPERLIERPRRILVLRTDQLGDIAISVPALRRLRELAPDAEIVGLLTTANEGLARSLGLFDEILIVDFPDVREERRRVMTMEEQERLRERLHGYAFDVAIDLAPADISRNLMLLSGAKLTVGFGRNGSPWLGAAIDFDVRDALGHDSVLPSAARTLALVEALGTLFAGLSHTEPAPVGSAARLARFGLAAGERFVLMHDGARIAFSRWPRYPALAARLLAERGLKVIHLTDERDTRARLPAALARDPRYLLIEERLPFEDLDALAAHSLLFVGNDSGPKHLAALRGTPVVSIHCARTNWGEWGQAGPGAIVTRPVPCSPCHIYHEPEECARDYVCITAITVDEVLAAAEPYLRRA
jgi:ADP-heptose:LPS heptosyltransferase